MLQKRLGTHHRSLFPRPFTAAGMGDRYSSSAASPMIFSLPIFIVRPIPDSVADRHRSDAATGNQPGSGRIERFMTAIDHQISSCAIYLRRSSSAAASTTTGTLLAWAMRTTSLSAIAPVWWVWCETQTSPRLFARDRLAQLLRQSAVDSADLDNLRPRPRRMICTRLAPKWILCPPCRIISVGGSLKKQEPRCAKSPRVTQAAVAIAIPAAARSDKAAFGTRCLGNARSQSSSALPDRQSSALHHRRPHPSDCVDAPNIVSFPAFTTRRQAELIEKVFCIRMLLNIKRKKKTQAAPTPPSPFLYVSHPVPASFTATSTTQVIISSSARFIEIGVPSTLASGREV